MRRSICVILKQLCLQVVCGCILILLSVNTNIIGVVTLNLYNVL